MNKISNNYLCYHLETLEVNSMRQKYLFRFWLLTNSLFEHRKFTNSLVFYHEERSGENWNFETLRHWIILCFKGGNLITNIEFFNRLIIETTASFSGCGFIFSHWIMWFVKFVRTAASVRSYLSWELVLVSSG